MRIHQVETKQKLPINKEEAWKFFSTPYNLKVLTPENMDFEITNGVTEKEKMYSGQIICYKIKLFPLVKMKWVTEITHVNEGVYFIDEQRFGPYAFWHHLHHISEIDGGVLMHDKLHYKMPFGILGSLVHALFVKKEIKRIFEYRNRKLIQLFGEFEEKSN